MVYSFSFTFLPDFLISDCNNEEATLYITF